MGVFPLLITRHTPVTAATAEAWLEALCPACGRIKVPGDLFSQARRSGHGSARGWEFDYWARAAFPSGGSADFGIYGDEVGETIGSPVNLAVEFVVYRKRRERWREARVSTGRDGLLPLFWARDMLELFEGFRLGQLQLAHREVRIGVEGEDARRLRVYTKGLASRGYEPRLPDGWYDRNVSKVLPAVATRREEATEAEKAYCLGTWRCYSTQPVRRFEEAVYSVL